MLRLMAKNHQPTRKGLPEQQVRGKVTKSTKVYHEKFSGSKFSCKLHVAKIATFVQKFDFSLTTLAVSQHVAKDPLNFRSLKPV